MKIDAIELTRLAMPLTDPYYAAWDPHPRHTVRATLVAVHTDEGVTGYASGDTMDGFDAYADAFIGTDPLQMHAHVRRIASLGFHGGRYWPLEAALWDIVGKVAGLPVSVLFGGARRSIPAYASTGTLKSPGDAVETALLVRSEGFRAMKLRMSPARATEGLAAIRAVRDAVGPEFGIIVDVNQMWRMPGDITDAADLSLMQRIARELADIGVLWLEEPLPARDIDGMHRIRWTTGVDVAGGEMVRELGDLIALVDADAFDIYQPDVVLAVGMSGARTVAEAARLRHRRFTPHTWTNGLGLLANLHVAAGVDAGPVIEYPYDPLAGWTPQRRDFFMQPVATNGAGELTVPDAPGLGVTIDWDAVRRHRS